MVKASSVWIKPTRKFKLLVHPFTTDPPQKIWLEAPPQDVPLRSGTTVRLICYATGGNPTGTLTWFKVKCVAVVRTCSHVLVLHATFLLQNGRVLANALKQTSFDRGVARELVLMLTASDNMATYHCNAQNEAEKTISAKTKLMVYCESDVTLSTVSEKWIQHEHIHIILYPDIRFSPSVTAISLKITTKQEQLHRGQTVTLECQSGSSNPKAIISWSLGTLRFERIQTGGQTHSRQTW